MTIANNNVVAKIAAVAAGLGLVLSSVAFAVPAKAATVSELEAQVAALLAQLQQMQGGATTAGAAFTMDLTIGATGAEVTRLQNWLIGKGYSIPAGATGYFGAQTAAAVAAYQTASGITPAVGYFGPMTRAKVNATLTTGGSDDSDDDSDNDSGDLEGGAGAIDQTDLLSEFNNEDVGEGDEDVEVAGLEIETDDGSDIELTAVRLVFDESDDAADDGSDDDHDDFDDYASEVSIWLDGEEVARVDADEFNDDNSWTKTVSLDSGAIIRAGDTGELVVAISAINNIDSGGEGDVWDVDFEQVRFRDADGATISETIAEDVREFTFTTFASAADISLDLSLTDGDDADDINEARVIDTDDNDETDGVEVLAFTLELEGNSEVTIDDLTFTVATGTSSFYSMVKEVRLVMDGDEVGSESPASSGATTITFDDLDIVLDGEDEYDFVVEVDLNENITNGSTLSFSMSEAQLEAADIEDESGEDLATSDISGSATGDAHGLYQSGMMVEFVSADETVTSPETGADRGTFSITFDVTAFDSDVYVDSSAPLASGGSGESDLTVTGTGTVISTITSSTGATAGAEGFLVDEDDTERFTITTNITATADGFFSVAVGSIAYALTDADATTYYAFNLADYKTDSVYLDTNS